MNKRPKLDHVKWVKSKGRVYAYFNTGQKKASGAVIYKRLPVYPSDGFYASYAAFLGGRTKRVADNTYTVAQMADDYLASNEYARKAEGTRKLYRIQLTKVTQHLGKFPVTDLQAKDIRSVLVNEDWGAATQNAFVAVVGAIFRWGRRWDKTKLTPTQGIDKEKTGEHDAWPKSILKAALEAEDDRIRLAAHLLYYTGQRIGDVCEMLWNNIEDDDIHVVQQKTGADLWIPLHRNLRAELARTPKKALTILSGAEGGRPSVWVLRKELQAFTRALGVETVPHGLRKNAVIALLEAGCTVPEVCAITGQTHEMAEHYAKQVNKRMLGKAAMLKFEGRPKTGTGNRGENQ